MRGDPRIATRAIASKLPSLLTSAMPAAWLARCSAWAAARHRVGGSPAPGSGSTTKGQDHDGIG